MKIGITNNQLSFRLKQQEVEELMTNCSIAEILEFGTDMNEQVYFGLQISPVTAFAFSFIEKNITIHIPHVLAENWATTDQPDIDGEINNNGRVTRILIEKELSKSNEEITEV